MSTQIAGSVRMAGDQGRPVTVQIQLDEETLSLIAPDGREIGTWPLAEVGIASKPDGFHLRIEGEEVVLTTEDDARFALALGINTPTSRLARQMARLRDQAAAQPDLVVDLTAGPDPVPALAEEVVVRPRRESRLANGLPYLGPLVTVAAVVAFGSAIAGAFGASSLTLPADLPAWPAMMATALILGAGGFAAFQSPRHGRITIGAGIGMGLIVVLLTAGRIGPGVLVGRALLAFTLAIVTVGVLLAVDTAGRGNHD